MALDLLTGAIQAYIFTILSIVFIGSAVGENISSQTAKEGKAT
ncbi:MAG: F0F1 ATP synthase subunit A, partial [Rhizomicrobium sp.]